MRGIKSDVLRPELEQIRAGTNTAYNVIFCTFASRAGCFTRGREAAAAGVSAVLQLRTSGVQLGTAYLLKPEASTSTLHQAALKRNAVERTVLTNLFTGGLGGGIVNRFMRKVGPVCRVTPAFPLAIAAERPLRSKAEAAGSGDFSPL